MDSVREFEVSQVTSKQLMHDFVLDYCQRQDWSPGKMEDLFYSLAGPGVYVGKLNGQPITGVAMFQHNKTYAYISLYFCEEEHRGKGYAFKTWMVAKASLNPTMNLVLDAEESAVHLYKREGFKRAWNVSCYILHAQTILKAYAAEKLVLPSGVTVKPASDVSFQKLKLYIEAVIGVSFDRPYLLESWIDISTHTSLAAEDSNGEIVGFGTIRETATPTRCLLAPLLAESGEIARILLFELTRSMDPKQQNTAIIEMNASPEINPETKRIVTEVNGKFDSVWPRMYTKQEPPIKKSKYFATFSTNIVG